MLVCQFGLKLDRHIAIRRLIQHVNSLTDRERLLISTYIS